MLSPTPWPGWTTSHFSASLSAVLLEFLSNEFQHHHSYESWMEDWRRYAKRHPNPEHVASMTKSINAPVPASIRVPGDEANCGFKFAARLSRQHLLFTERTQHDDS